MVTTKRAMAEVIPAGWVHGERDERVKQLRLSPRRVRVLLAAEWAGAVLPIFEAKTPGDDRPRKAIEAAEAWADGPSEARRKAAAAAAAAAADAAYAADAAAYAADAAYAAAAAAAAYAADAADAAAYAADAASAAAAAADVRKSKWLWLYATYRHARGPKGATFDRRWRTETAVALARGIVAGRAFDRMPILADALEEAGFDPAGELARLRTPGDEFTAADWALWNLLGYGGE
jgi:hypothetical protein